MANYRRPRCKLILSRENWRAIGFVCSCGRVKNDWLCGLINDERGANVFAFTKIVFFQVGIVYVLCKILRL